MSDSASTGTEEGGHRTFLPVSRWEWWLTGVFFVLVVVLYLVLVPRLFDLGGDAAFYVVGGSLGAFGLGADLWSRIFHKAELAARSKSAGWIATTATVLGLALSLLAPSLDPDTKLLPWPESGYCLLVLTCLAVGGFGLLMVPVELLGGSRKADN